MVNLSTPAVKFKKDNFLATFESFEKKTYRKDPSWVSGIRKNAIERFKNLNFPTMREESWKYTNVSPLLETPFASASEAKKRSFSSRELEPFSFGEKDWQKLVFVNGAYAARLSSVTVSRDDLRVENLGSILARDPKLAEPYLAQLVPCDQNIFAAFNTAFIHDGAFIDLPEGKVLSKPIHLIFLSVSEDEAMVSHPRVLIVARKNSKATVIESYVSLGHGSYFTNAVTEIVLEGGASVEHYKLQRESEEAFHIATTQVHQNRDSRFTSFSIALGGKLSRNSLNVGLDAEGAECTLNGLYLTADNQHVDNTTLIDHSKPRGTSSQLYKGILSGKSTGVFSGKVFVHKDAQKTDAHQINKNLLLSDQAAVNTKPQLEILADDVQCTHGAAVGQLDEQAIFYFETRGIGREKARKLLSYGFANEVIQTISLEPLRTELNHLVFKRLEDFSCLPEALKHRGLEKDSRDEWV